VGDVHGQFYDLLKILSIGGNPETTKVGIITFFFNRKLTLKYLFLGDYVDRGVYSTEVMILLLCMKINYPSTFVLLRGNHECRQMTISFTFRQEILLKYDQEVFEAFCSLFDYMPLSCIINGKFIAVHAGISPELKTLSDLNKINRFHGNFYKILKTNYFYFFEL